MFPTKDQGLSLVINGAIIVRVVRQHLKRSYKGCILLIYSV